MLWTNLYYWPNNCQYNLNIENLVQVFKKPSKKLLNIILRYFTQMDLVWMSLKLIQMV